MDVARSSVPALTQASLAAPVRTTPTVAVVGAGASGTLAAAHLVRAAGTAGRRVDLLLIDPARPGTGVAYGTEDLRHRLNVPAHAMSAWPDDADHFVRWLRRTVDVDADADSYAPRWHYGRYLADVLSETVRNEPGVRLAHLALRATDVRRVGRRMRVTLSDGTYRPVDAVVLALGHGVPSTTWAPPALRSSARFVADPWRGASPAAPAPGGAVLLVGAGLTAVDTALRVARPGVTVHLASRSGLLPLPHARRRSDSADTGADVGAEIGADADIAVPAELDYVAARRLVFDAIRACDGDWRRAVDRLRPVTSPMWLAMPEPERRRFLRVAARRWERVRHRTAPAVDDWLRGQLADGTLVTHVGGVADAREEDDRLVVTLADGSRVAVAAVYNCTGATADVRASTDPLLLNLFAAGSARPGPLGLGLDTDDRGRIVAEPGTSTGCWTLGPLRRGQLWETTAIPEIRMQAADLARDIVAALPDPNLRRRPRDTFGLPLSTSDAAAGAYRAALGCVLRVQSGAEQLVGAAVEIDPDFALGHAVRALLGAEWSAERDARAVAERHLDRAEQLASRADEREQRFIEVAARRVREPGPDSAAALLAYIDAYPEDALAVSVAVPTIAFGGATDVPSEAWSLVDRLAPAYGDHWWYLSLAAFTRQEQRRYAEAAEFAAVALQLEPASGHAAHAKSHAHYETGDHLAGLAWLDGWIERSAAASSARPHFAWHAALHELALGDYEAMATRYARQLAPPAVGGVRALVDSSSLLWRARVTGVAPQRSGVDQVLATVPGHLLTSPGNAFIAMHAALALAAADDCVGLARLRRHAERVGLPVFTRVVAPLADALGALVHGDVDEAADGLLGLDDVDTLGGSHAQREVLEDTTIHCAIRAGRLELARALLAQRLDRRESPHDRARLRSIARRAADLQHADP